jgi:4-hydroxybenzoate polyprenyltransferase
MKKFKLLFNTSRPVSWVNTAYPFAAGYLMMGGNLDARLILGTLFFLIPYNLMMYGINDVFDYESDIRNPRKGGVEGAITPKKYHPLIIQSSILSSLPFVILLISMGSPFSALALLSVIFFVVAYSTKGLRFKEIPFLDSITSSLHFVGPLIYAYTLVGATPDAWLAALAFFAWGIGSQSFGAVQDVQPDREAGIKSIATVLGARRTIWFSASMYTLAVALTALVGGPGLIVAASGLMYTANVMEFRNITDATSARARRGWKRFIWINYAAGAIVSICLILSKV